MHDAACSRSGESTCRLLDYIQSEGERHRSIAAHARFTRFAQKTGPRARILRDLAIDDLEGNMRVQNCIARAISYGHRSRAELNRKTVCSRLYFEVGISQWSGC